ncbi:MAG TPA: VOC family protein [Kofleriaceae bacterium]|nr:VOC family protein [Kofleriaceae bacterium]
MSDARPFRVLGVQQIAIGGPSKDALAKLWVDLFGLAREGTFRSEKENVDEDILVMGKGAARVEVDIMQPIDPEKSPKVHQPPLNHIGLWIDDLAAAVAWLTGQGVELTPGGIRRGASGFDVCFIHPRKGGEGVLIELVQAPAEIIAALG